MKLLIVLLFLMQQSVLAQALKSFVGRNITPLRSAKEVHPGSQVEQVLRLKSPQIVIADYQLLRRDFPHLEKLSDPEIDKWLLKETGYISMPQQAQTVVNSKIPILVGQERKAFRPPEYGRALVYEVYDKDKLLGVLDVKGAGGLTPSHASHSSGTMTLGEALREFSYEKMVTSVVDHTGIDKKVVGAYAVIFPGFDVVHENGSKSPAGFYVRQAHRRMTTAESKLTREPRGNGWMESAWRERYRSLLNKYGIFANNNYQGTLNNDLFDFGHYIVRDDLPNSDKKLLVPFDRWGFDNPNKEPIFSGEDRWKFSKRDRPWNWAHETAQAFAEGRANRHHVWMYHFNLVDPVQKKLESIPRLYTFSESLGFPVLVCERAYQPKSFLKKVLGKRHKKGKK